MAPERLGALTHFAELWVLVEEGELLVERCGDIDVEHVSRKHLCDVFFRAAGAIGAGVRSVGHASRFACFFVDVAIGRNAGECLRVPELLDPLPRVGAFAEATASVVIRRALFSGDRNVELGLRNLGEHVRQLMLHGQGELVWVFSAGLNVNGHEKELSVLVERGHERKRVARIAPFKTCQERDITQQCNRRHVGHGSPGCVEARVDLT